MVEDDNIFAVVEQYCTGQPDENADVHNEEEQEKKHKAKLQPSQTDYGNELFCSSLFGERSNWNAINSEDRKALLNYTTFSLRIF